MIKTIIFDMTGIFFENDYTPRLEPELFALFKANGAKSCDYHRVWRRIRSKFSGITQIKEVRLRYLSELNLSYSVLSRYEKLVERDQKRIKLLDSNTIHYLKKFKRAGLCMVILTNTMNTKRNRINLLNNLNLSMFFDEIFCSSEIGYSKPDLRSYKYVLKSLKIRPKDTIFVGHSKDELDGAAKVGIIPIRFTGKFKKLNLDILKRYKGEL